MTLPKSMKVDPELVRLYALNAEERFRDAARSRQHGQIAAIKHHRANGMSRRRLIAIYGAELVNEVLANG